MEKRRKEIYLHIGTHKTGSTSFQRFLFDNTAMLRDLGYDVYAGNIERENHIELYLAAMRFERDSFAKQKFSLKIDQNFVDSTAVRVQTFISRSPADKIVLTTEGLSLLRFPDEIERLRNILDSENNSVRIICNFRDKKDFLDSYRSQLFKVPGRTPSDDPDSAFYVKDDSWLADFEALRNLYRAGFGESGFVEIDYDLEMRTRRNILPAMIEALNLDPLKFSKLQAYKLNTTHINPLYRMAKRLKSRIQGSKAMELFHTLIFELKSLVYKR